MPSYEQLGGDRYDLVSREYGRGSKLEGGGS